VNSRERPAVTVIITHLGVGGAENVALSLAERLAADFRLSFFIVLEEQAETDVGRSMAAGLQALTIPFMFGSARPFKRGGVVEAAWNLRRFIAAQRPQLLHVHTEIPELTLALATMLPGLAQTSTLRTIHNAELWGGWGAIGRWVERRLGRAAVAGVSQAALAADDRLRAVAGAPVLPPAWRRLIYNGVEIGNPVTRVRQPGPQRVLFAGRFEPQKGADLLPAILAAVATRTTTPFEVTLMGSGSLGDRLTREVAGLSCRVRVVPPIPDLAQHLAGFDVVLMPSRFEGLPLVAIEALLAGVPIIATAAPGLAEVVPPNDLLSAPIEDVEAIADRLANYLRDPKLYRDRVAMRLPELRAHFSAASTAAKYAQFYTQLIGN
jgi:glycosyltransferase involved in cell wall biosynthesis